MRLPSRFLHALVIVCAAFAAQAQPQFGPIDPDFAPVDAAARDYINRYGLPGVTLVVAHGERIIYAQGYGHADRERLIPSSPWHEYRLAGVGKTLAAAAVMRLVEQGKLSLEAKAWDLIRNDLGFLANDERFRQVTVRQLLTHSWGLDRAITSDPNGTWYIDPAGQTVTDSRLLLYRYLFGNRLDLDPGARHAYNGLGYSWLQAIAELVERRPLAQQITEMLGHEALSSGRVRVGQTLPTRLTLAEPRYYDRAGAPLAVPVPKLYPAPEPALVPRPDGSFTLDAHGGGSGLVASPLTLTRFIQRLQGIRLPALLAPASWAQMQAEQTLADGTRNIGLGVTTTRLWDSAPDRQVSSEGRLAGSRTGWTSLPREPGGPRLTVVALVNGSRDDALDGSSTGDSLMAELIQPVIAAMDSITPASYAGKPEIEGDRLIAWDSATEAYYVDLLLDWGQIKYPEILKGTPVAGIHEGYRYRYYAASKTYVGMKQGRVYLYQPDVSPEIQFVNTMGAYLPQAMREMASVRPIAARPGSAAR